MKTTIDYEQIFEECKSLLRSIDIPIASDDNLFISFNLKSNDCAEAYCSQFANGFEIELKHSYITAKNPDINHLKNLIMHELVHTCNGCLQGMISTQHSTLFLSYAKKIHDSLNYNILEFENLMSYRNGDKPIKILAHCDKCGCSQIFRSQKDIESDIFARSSLKYANYTDFCPYCNNHTFLYKNINV